MSLKNFFVTLLAATAALAAPHKGHADFHKKRDSSGKKGAAYNDISLVSLLTGAGGGVTWAYNWDSKPGGTLPPGVEYVPMLWGSRSFDGWDDAVNTALSSGSKYLLGFNEPDNAQQAMMSPQDAAMSFKQYMTPYADRAKLVSPAITNSQNPGEGLDWMRSFLQACTDCQQSVMAVHWYGGTNGAEDFKQHIQQCIDLANQNGMNEVWVTEFAATGDPMGQAQFLRDVIPWLESQPAVGRYAYFMVAEGMLISGGALSAIGEAYLSP
ncbi:hypothetical protein VTN00DRAFT_4767 [Thermoascus crustaceus]|uniref:uncharacterized protein n=1 Tax=Thermoascus crustaceus TaxID=5088 RepID=UPI003742E663